MANDRVVAERLARNITIRPIPHGKKTREEGARAYDLTPPPLVTANAACPRLLAHRVDLVFLVFVHFLNGRVAAGFARRLGCRGRRTCVWQRRLPGRRPGRPRCSRGRRRGLSGRCLCLQQEGAGQQQRRERG